MSNLNLSNHVMPEAEVKIKETIENMCAKLRVKAEDCILYDEKAQFPVIVEKHLAVESRMLMTKVYYALQDRTLEQPTFKIPANRSAFHSANILRCLEEKLEFNGPVVELPASIITEDVLKRREMCFEGAGLTLLSFLIVNLGLAVTTGLVTLLLVALNKYSPASLREAAKKAKEEKDKLINTCIESISSALYNWVDQIVECYDDLVAELEKQIASNKSQIS